MEETQKVQREQLVREEWSRHSQAGKLKPEDSKTAHVSGGTGFCPLLPSLAHATILPRPPLPCF